MKSTVMEDGTLKKICGFFLLLALISCTMGCGQDTDRVQEGTELVKAGEQSPVFSFRKGIVLDPVHKDCYN